MLLRVLALALLAGCAPDGTAPLAARHVPPRAAGAVDRGPTDASRVLRLVVGVGLAGTLRDLPPGRMTATEFADRYAVSAADYARLVDWLAGEGLTVVRTAPGRTTVTVEGTVPAVERAFAVHLHEFEDAGGRFFGPTGEPLIPRLFSRDDAQVAVAGLDDATHWHSDVRAAVPEASSPATPADLRALYGYGTVAQTGTGETVAILGAGRAPARTDVATYVADYGLPTNVSTQYSQVLVDGASRDYDPQGNEYLENCLDAEMVFAVAPAASVVHVLPATNTPGLFSDGLSYIVNQLPQAHAVSLSYGQCERLAAGEMAVENILYAQAKAEGQQWFAATGDYGTDGCRDGSGNVVLSVGWPASSPYVVGVGGTKIANGAEVVWGGVAGGGAGTGGHSEDFDKPSWQTGVGPYPNDAARDEPDVAALAGPPYIVIVTSGQLEAVAGTSAATPMWAGVWALLDQAKGGHGITNAHEGLYSLGKQGLGFHDVTVGNNSDGNTPGFPALAGYDLATGWGSPNVPSLVQSWQ